MYIETEQYYLCNTTSFLDAGISRYHVKMIHVLFVLVFLLFCCCCYYCCFLFFKNTLIICPQILKSKRCCWLTVKTTLRNKAKQNKKTLRGKSFGMSVWPSVLETQVDSCYQVYALDSTIYYFKQSNYMYVPVFL